MTIIGTSQTSGDGRFAVKKMRVPAVRLAADGIKTAIQALGNSTWNKFRSGKVKAETATAPTNPNHGPMIRDNNSSTPKRKLQVNTAEMVLILTLVAGQRMVKR
jgi:hypothetical protein